ncbi:D-glycero-beta-D-manno-heptose 1,7-bisphosphate 7-phosphatase [Hydrogenimonas urashimensis]|uniref:D-glycero-beta-D-manno-heptose 1,7-bisphosphate 7-phosphatase n=1 Tax=Hydrogenimonas urashimensis TaxID=2740515 RepID=UPI0019151005|nr:D-glycero-beta-D-manno-heptose 1,7-bisphosphate 7-phosphatase [Hydrogenimonas urashimensis]
MRKALFLDRDGVINVDHGYVSRIEDFEFVDGILAFVKKAQKKGYLPVIVTNQSGIGRGYYSEEDFEKLTTWMIEKMREAGIDITREQVFSCPHDPAAGCDCRKPMPGMFLAAQKRFGIDMAQSWMIGDKPSDVEAAKRAGVGHTLLVEKNRTIDVKELHGF